MDIYRRIFEPPKAESFFLFGPRGTGKSLLLKQRFQNALKIDLLLPHELRKYSARPERLIDLVKAHPDQKTIVIDEIQKVPELLSVVHHLLEEKLGKHFILTGSSSRKIKRSGIDLLGGRASHERLFPFVPYELGRDFNLDQALQFGLVPLVITAPQPSRRLKAYIDLYLKEEIRAEGLVKDLGAFSRFLEAMTFSHAEILNISNIARECEVERKSIERYVEILEDTLIGERLSVFDRNAKRELIAQSKFYFFDTGVFRSLIPFGTDLDGPRKGVFLEGFIYQILRAHCSYSSKACKLHYWKTRGGSEVDFILDFGKKISAIEVKSSTKVHRADLSGLKTFLEDYPQAAPFFVYRGSESLKIDGISCLPVMDFLQQIKILFEL